MKMKNWPVIVLTALVLQTLAACSALNPKVDFPVTTEAARPAVATGGQPTLPTGSLYSGGNFRPLFEDRRARYVGDLITVVINERMSSSQKNLSSAQREDSASIAFPALNGFFGTRALDAEASGKRKFNGQGESTANNTILGTIAVTVQEVLPNGNLVVSGERQLGTNGEVETIRFYGVVNPVNVLGNNTVSSTQVADARIEYRGKGQIDAATTMGWLSRFFLTVLPF